ncbi:MAG TPA: RNA polymerase sigma-70 factor [Herpetosiphonaceae bacterium]
MSAAEALERFEDCRPALFGLAYRMLGSVMDADDILQEAFLRWQGAPAERASSAKAYLVTIVTRLCIDALRSARARRETYIGPWLPEPWLGAEEDPAQAADAGESISFALLVLLERLTPLERAVFVLHDIFAYSYAEIGAIIGVQAAYCRQLGHRARGHARLERPRFEADPERVAATTRQFLRASQQGDLRGLLDVFMADIVLWSDGGGKASAALNPIHGADRVSRFMVGVLRKATAPIRLQAAVINGRPGVIGFNGGVCDRAFILELAPQGGIQTLYCVRNPDKLRRAQAAAGAGQG